MENVWADFMWNADGKRALPLIREHGAVLPLSQHRLVERFTIINPYRSF
jgi:hypothetical protein